MPDPLPFEYPSRASQFVGIPDQIQAQLIDERDRALEDYLQTAEADIAALEASATASEWTSFTPSVGNLTLGNGTMVGRYCYPTSGLLCVYLGVLFGTTTSISGNLELTLPDSQTSNSFLVGNTMHGHATFNDSGTTTYSGVVRGGSGTTVVDILALQDTSYVSRVILSNTVPFTWTSGDYLSCLFTVPV